MKFTKAEVRFITNMLHCAIDWELSVIDAHQTNNHGTTKPMPYKGYEYVVRRANRNIDKCRKLIGKIDAENIKR